ncbi:GAF domain-containing protein [Actinomycetes bacterium KLBMP 9759]
MDPSQLRALRQVHAEIVGALDRAAALRAGLAALAADPSDVAWIAEPDGPDRLVLRHLHGGRTDVLRGLLVPEGTGLTGRTNASGRPGWVDDYFTSGAITHDFDWHIRTEGIRRLLAVPLVRERVVIGVAALGVRSDGRFGDRAVERATTVAESTALAISVAERARLSREVAVHEERRRMAADLHDSVGALLFAIGSGVASLAEQADPELRAPLERLQRHAADATSALRESLRMLRASPAALELGVALRADCAAFADRTGLPAELVVLDDDPPALPGSRSQVLLAGVREALLNVERHARASAVVVTVSRQVHDDRTWLAVAVTDDGTGLPPDHARGLGLTSSAEALARLGGTLDVTSDQPGGTTWRARLPC